MTMDATGRASMTGGGEVLRDLLSAVYRRRSILVIALLTTTVVATVASLVTPLVYEASSTVIADKTPPVVLLSNPGGEANLVQQLLAQAPDAFTLTELAKSEAVRDGAMSRLAPPLNPKQVRDILSRQVHVQHVRTSDLVRVSVRYRDRGVAAAVANAVAQAVVEMDLKARRRQAAIAREFIGEQLEIAGRELRANHHALAAFKKDNHDVSLSDETQLNLRKLTDLEVELTHVRLDQQQVQSGFARPLGVSSGTSQEALDPVITTLQSQLASLQVEYTGLRKQFTPLHPQVISTQAKIGETQRRLDAEMAHKQAALDNRERSLSTEIAGIERALTQVPTREAMLARLALDARGAERNYLALSEKFQQARIAEGSIGSAVRIVDGAKAPERPIGPQRRTSIALGVMLGLLLGATGVYAIEQLDGTVKSAKEVERLLGASVLGVAPLLAASPTDTIRGNSPVELAQVDSTSVAVETFRVLRTHVLQAMRAAELKRVIITSASPHEGKTTVASSLAITAARTGRRVWLVDCNLRNPTLHRLFPEAQSPGLCAFLRGRAAVDEVVRPTRQPRLDCVVSGQEILDPSELLDSQLMTDFLDQARDWADVVLLDCPAITPVTDAEVVGLRADGAIVVVEIGKTDRLALAQARQRLDSLGIRLLGAVLNQGPDDSSTPFAAALGQADRKTKSSVLLAKLNDSVKASLSRWQ